MNVWQAMQAGDVLVLYQHQTNRTAKPWIEAKRRQFEKVLDLGDGTAKVAGGNKIARDVVFFYCRKEAR